MKSHRLPIADPCSAAVRYVAAATIAFLIVRSAIAQSTSDIETFFEQQIRPLLVESCVECHGADKAESGLRLDSRTALVQGGDRGPAIVVGDANSSRLVEAIRYVNDELQMPPDGQLPDRQIRALQQWIDAGAPWPVEAAGRSSDTETREDVANLHWSFAPVRRSMPPAVSRRDWCRNPIDAFVLAELEHAGLAPSPQADRPTLIRRAYLDLVGLPPRYDQVQSFVKDPHPDAYERLVEQLLASPQYAERWARHWLDVARYADTKGYLDGGQSTYPFAYTYRNYVLRTRRRSADRYVLPRSAGSRPRTIGCPRSLAVGRYGISDYGAAF